MSYIIEGTKSKK